MKIAIIGFGGMGDFHREKAIVRHNDSAERIEDIYLAGIYDIDAARCEYAESLGLHVFSSAEEIWADKEIEAVVIATPNVVHLPYVLAAAKAGKNIIVEKPAGMSLEEVKAMYDAAEEAGVVFTPHQNRRLDDDYLTVKHMIADCEFGKTYRIESSVMGANGIPGAWRKEKARGGGMMLDWGVHLIDQMLCMIDGKITSILANYSYEAGEEVDDGFDMEVKFDTGVTYRIVVDTNTFIKPPRWKVYGKDGTAIINNWQLEGKIVHCVIRHDDRLEGISAGNGFTKTMASRRSETVEELPIKEHRADKASLYLNFVKAIRLGEKTMVTREQIERLFKVMELAGVSAREQKVILEKF